MGKGQYIFGRASPISISDKGKEMLKSSGTVVSDFIEHDFTSARDGILCSFESIPIAFYDISTLNGMVFSRALWEGLLKNQYFMRTIEDGSHFGEASHADRDEVLLKEVACRVNKLWFGSNNLVLGNVDILDTPNGRIIHSLAKISRVGISSRGFGELVPRHDGLKDVDPDSYSHICFDMVAFPAVPDASMTLITGDNALPNTEMMNMSATLRDTSYNDPSLFNSLKNTLIAQEVRRKLSYKSLFSVGKSRIFSISKGNCSFPS